VKFGNLPTERVIAEHKKLPDGAGYIRLNIFLDPVSVMPEFERAISDLRDTPGIVLDLRGNPGGLGIMAMGLAGWFVSEEGQVLGTMLGRDSKTQFEINPRLEPYTGKLAILVNGSSASTSEILAQGLKDLGRARIFGTRTMGAALPSEVIQLPDGDRFQYPEANYTSFKGRVLEGNGVEPDVVAAPTIAALLAGRDMALESALSWITGK
jgi:carboxyl-terminal processing protease